MDRDCVLGANLMIELHGQHAHGVAWRRAQLLRREGSFSAAAIWDGVAAAVEVIAGEAGEGGVRPTIN